MSKTSSGSSLRRCTLALVLTLLPTDGMWARQTAGQTSALDRLEHGTGWIFVADIDPSSGLWLSQPKHTLKSSTASTPSNVPVAGDVLELVESSQLVILRYADSLELNRLACPVGRPIEKGDIVGRLSPGTLLEVREVCRERVISGFQGIWARVVRAPER